MAPAIDEALGQDDATVAAAAAAADRLFPIIKPLCVACLDPPVWQVQNASSPLAALRRALEEYLSGRTNGGRNGPDRSDGDCRKGLGILADYVLFPLTKGLGSDNSSIYALENALHVVSVTLGADPSRPVSQSVFMDLLVFLPLLLKDGRVNRRSSGKEHRSTSEEFKLAAISALQSLFHDDDVSATNGDVSTDPAVVIRVRKSAMERRRMVKPEYFAQMISVLLDLSNEERSLQVRLAALDCIQQWIQWVNNPAMVSKFLPGIASALVKVIVNNLNSNHRLITQSCTLLSDIVTLTCGDTRFKEEILPKAPSTLVALAAQSASEPKSSSEADVWLETASTRLHATFATILSHRGHPNPQIRHSFLHLIVKVLEGCAHSLSICLPLLLEALVFYFDDEDASIREECELFFRHVEAFLPSHFDLKRALTDNLGKTLSKIPTALRGVDASSKRTQIRSAIGYLSLMSDSCRPVLSAQMEPFLRAVLSTVKFSSLHFSLIIDRNVEGAFAAIGDVYSRTGSLTSTKEIGNLPDSDSLADFERFLNLFAIYSDKLELLSSLNVQLSTIIDTRPCLFIQNEILRGIRMSVSGQASNSNSKRSLRMPSVKPLSRVEKYALGDVLRTYLSVLEKAMDNNSLDLDDKSLHITEQCLVLEGVGEIALALQRDFEELLIDSLYLIILELGSQSRAVSQAAWHCLCSIALACGHRGDDAVKQLIVSNIDYVVNDVCHRLRYPTENPLTPYVLIASLDVAGPKIVPFLDDTIDEIFDAIDRTAWRNEQLLYSLFRVLDTLAGVLLVSTKTERITAVGENDIRPSSQNLHLSEAIRRFLLLHGPDASDSAGNDNENDSEEAEVPEDFFRRRMEEAETAEETGGKEGDEEGDGTEEPSPAAAGNERDVEAPEATREESIAKRILALCPHYLASDDPNFSTFVLALVRRAIPLMHARSAERNQAIHALWPGVVRRLSSPDHRVVAAALDAVKAFASEAREFVKRRVVDDVLPRVDSFLRTFEPHASKAARRHHHQHLQQQQQQQQQQTLVRWDPQVPDGTRTRVLTCALEMMALILDALPAFSVRELKQILDVVWPFVQVGETGVEDPRGLVRTAAASVLAGVQAHDADLVWLKRQQEACASANQAAEFVPAKQNPGCNRLEMPRWVMGEIRRGNAGG